MLVQREFSFDSAHHLTNYYGKCENMHGHTYRLLVTLEGPVQSNGLVIDFVVLKRIVKKHVLDILDHRVLNDVIDNPSAECVAVWIWDRLKNLHALLKEEMGDPNLAEEIRKFLKDGEPAEMKVFDKALRLHEIALYETGQSGVIYRGEA